MDEYMQKLVKSKEFEIYKNLDKATLKIMLMYLKFNLIEIYKQNENEASNNQICCYKKLYPIRLQLFRVFDGL